MSLFKKIFIFTLFFSFLAVSFDAMAASPHKKKKKSRRRGKVQRVWLPNPNRPDSLQKKWSSIQPLSADSDLVKGKRILDTNPVFQEFWKNDVLFVYGSVPYDSIPDTLRLNLVQGDESFRLNWYGMQYWGYGPRWGLLHRGLDLYLDIRDTVVSAFDGVVRYARMNDGGYGNCVIVRHLNGLETLYGHLDKVCIPENAFVKAGQMVGLGGSTGRSDGPHLHWETRYKDFSFDPMLIIDSVSHQLKAPVIALPKTSINEYRYPIEAGKFAYLYRTNGKKGKGMKGVSGGGNGGKYYTVRKGDTVSAIARRNHVSTQAVIKMNGLQTGQKIYAGQRLRVK